MGRLKRKKKTPVVPPKGLCRHLGHYYRQRWRYVHRGIIALLEVGDYRRQSYGICGICHILPLRHYQQKVNVVIRHQKRALTVV
jgi:hypothetical protein